MLSILYYECSIDTSFKTTYSTFDVHSPYDYSEMKKENKEITLLILSIWMIKESQWTVGS